MSNPKQTRSSSTSIGSNSNHSTSSTSSSRLGTFVSITVRKDDPASQNHQNQKAGIKLQQDSTGRVKVKNIARNGLFDHTDLEVGDIVLSVNRHKLKDGEGPDQLMKWVHKYNTITISVRKPTSSTSSSSVVTSSTSATKKKKKKTKTTKSKGITKTKMNVEKKKIVTFTAEKHHSDDRDPNDGQHNIGLVFEIRNTDQLFVKDILPSSMFPLAKAMNDTKTTTLDIGDRILCINDMNFREFADVEYAYRILKKAKIMVTLVVEKHPPPRAKKQGKKKKKNTPSTRSSTRISKPSITDDDDDTSISSFSALDYFNNDEFCIDDSHHSLKKTTTKKEKSDDKMSNKTSVSSSSSSSSHNNHYCPSNSMTNSSRYEFEVESDFKIEKYRPETITVSKLHKSACSTDTIGVQFALVKTLAGDTLNDVEEHEEVVCNCSRTTSWISVTKIDKDSFFANTPLQVGDKVISINDTNLRKSVNDETNGNHFVDTRTAYQACLKAREFITMVVLKQDETYFEKSFLFDTSGTNLEWKF